MMKQIRLFVAFLKFIFAAVCIVNVMFFLGAFQENDSCYSRYNLDKDKNNKYHINSSKVADTILLNANGYYNSKLDSKSPSSYGQWKKSNIFLSKDINVVVNIQGEVSLCKSYLTLFSPE
jgi:hypothetical protein